MILRLSSCEIHLDPSLNLEERKAFVNDILEKYPEEFAYSQQGWDTKFGQRIDIDIPAKGKLSMLGTYLIHAEPEYRETVITPYREKQTSLREIPVGEVLYAKL